MASAPAQDSAKGSANCTRHRKTLQKRLISGVFGEKSDLPEDSVEKGSRSHKREHFGLFNPRFVGYNMMLIYFLRK